MTHALRRLARLPWRGSPGAAGRSLALLCALHIWLLGMLAVSPALHAALHADSDHGDHACAVTLFAHGTDDPAADPVLGGAPLSLAGALLPGRTEWPCGTGVDRLPPSCGPPIG